MEDDDEFGDLYTDVLRQFQPSSPLERPKLPSPKRPIDPNLQSDDEEILFGAPNSNPEFHFTTSHQSQTLASESKKGAPEPGLAQSSDSNRNLGGKQEDQEVKTEEGLAERASLPTVLDSGDDLKSHGRGFEGPESGIDFVVEERDDEDDVLVGKDEVLIDKEENFDNFDIEEPEPVIPGVSDAGDHRGDSNMDDWDSDSDDDLHIVLNDNNHHGPMVGDRLVGTGDEDDEDGDPLVIVADSEPGHQLLEEQEWGEDAAQAADGERKEVGDAAKVNGGGGAAVVAPKIGYNSNYTYHPYHSQFKYVRPGAAPMPGAAPVGFAGAPGQVRPPVNMGPVAGFGRGDWRPTGIRGASPMQKPGFGMHVWGNNTAGRGFGSGLDFTLPSHKTIFEVEVDSFEEKPWRLPGLDVSDFFNFGLNEESWKDYCKQLEQLRMETTMQSKIRVYESGRTEQEYDPDLPPELAAAAGIRDISAETANLAKTDAGQSDVANGSSHVRPPLPTGRAIQVETGYGERLPSIDTRPPRIRDSDAIIEIVLQDSSNDGSSPGNDITEKLENDPSREDFRGGQDTEGNVVEEHTGLPQAYNSRKREMVGRRAPFMNSIHDNLIEGDGILSSPQESLVPYRVDPRGQTSAYPGRDVGTLHEDRQTKGRARDRSPIMTRSGSTLDKGFGDNNEEASVESIGGKHSHQLSSPGTVGSAEEPDIEHGDGLDDELDLADGSFGMEDREDMALDKTTVTDTHMDEKPLPSMKMQKLSSCVEQSSVQEIDELGDLKAARSRENSKARSESSRDYQKLRDSIDEEVVQHRGHSTHTGNLKRPRGEDEQSVRRKSRDEKHVTEKHRMVGKGWEDSYARRDLDPHLARHPHVKTEGIDRRKERDNSEGVWQRQDEDPQGRRARAEDTRKRDRGDELGLSHRNKVRQEENMDKDEHLQLRKQLDNGYSRGYHDKEVGSRPRERDDYLKSRYENIDDLYSKRRKEEHFRRDAEKEEILQNHRENISRRRRERDGSLDLRKRDDQARTLDDNHHSVRHKEDGWMRREMDERQKERDVLHKIKQSREESLSKREREGGRGGLRSGRAAEDKTWVTHARVKDEHKDSDRDYQFKDTGRHNEQLKRRDRAEDGSLPQHRGREDVHSRGSQLNNDERRSLQERESTRSERAVGGSDNNRVHEKKRKENTRKSKDSEGGDRNSVGPLKRNQEDQSGHMNEPVMSKGITEQGKQRADAASSDDEQRDSRRGRSKLERWTSHKEMDFIISSKSSSSLKVKETGKHKTGGSSIASKLPEESLKTMETTDNQHPLGDQEDVDPDIKNVDVKSVDDRHSDTVAKLKKRSERFKLPMPSEKEAAVIKKMEIEPLPSAQGEAPQSEARAESEIKMERPPRKRRWISN